MPQPFETHPAAPGGSPGDRTVRFPLRSSGPPSPLRAGLLPALLALFLLWPSLASAQISRSGELVELKVATVAVDLHTGTTLALLHSDWQEVLPIWIGEVEAGAIADALMDRTPVRPMTHDLLTSVLSTLGGELDEIVVHDLRENIYFGTLRIRTPEGMKEVDSRPSDALALAVRTGARIRADRSLIEEAPDVEFLSLEGERTLVRLRGMTVSTIEDEDRERFSLPTDRAGVVVLHADDAVGPRGVRRGDLILEVEGRDIRRPDHFLDAVSGAARDQALEVLVLRNGDERTVRVPPRRPPPRIGP